MSRYDIHGEEGEFQPGSDGQVLRNKLDIVDPIEINEAELELLLQLYEYVFGSLSSDEQITVPMIKEWHRKWLGNLYEWAGKERTVQLSKGGFAFANAELLPRLLGDFERDFLSKWTPCTDLDPETLIQAIAEVHVEFILIHPFREGNGRIARLVADVMAFQAGFETIDYTVWDEDKEIYIGAIHAGLAGEYGPMEGLVRRALGI